MISTVYGGEGLRLTYTPLHQKKSTSLRAGKSVRVLLRESAPSIQKSTRYICLVASCLEALALCRKGTL